jgi:biopolymer transport protein ExbD
LTRLRETLQKIQGRSQTIIIKADKRALYGNISAVMNAALETGFPVVLATAEERLEDL